MADERHAKGAVVHALRHAQGATLTDLAHRAGLSPGYLSRVERGERAPSWYATVRLASALDTVPAVLTGLLPPLGQLRRAMFGGEHSLADFAALAGVDSDRLLEYESGSTSLDTKELTRLASVLRVDLDVFHSSRRSGVQLPD
jgi:transcriptional regulator with XRE-family HTH domain